ncbi:mucin-22-like isoform X2 [Dermacentor albipictus]|uniref:mucin-22-like isoform X2 n=1 Tax=Dermacentor albipictus TaxID=60249 RepID=UPI0038FC417A
MVIISSRKAAMYWITAHMVPNIVGAIRFSYGFHRTGSEDGVILDIWLGAECIANLCCDFAVNFLLWKAESTQGTAVDAWTHVDADHVTTDERVKLVAVWVPVITIAAMCKIYYTMLLYKFYRTYKDTNGRAFDGAPKAAAKSAQAEGDRTFTARTPDDVTAQNITKSMEGTMLTTKSQNVKSRRQSVAAEDQTTTIQPRGSKSKKSVLPPKTKTGKPGDRSRRQSTDEGNTTILPAGKNYGKVGGHSRRQSTASETRRDVASLLGDMSKGPSVGANRRGTTSAATTARKAAAAGAKKGGKKSQRPPGTATADASAMTETTRKTAPRSRRQSVTAEGDDTQRPSSAGSTPPLQTSRRQSVAAVAALAAAQLAAQDRARRKSLTGADSTGVGATSTPKKYK